MKEKASFVHGEGNTMSLIDAIRDMFSYSFLLRAMIVGVLVSLCASLLGVSLVLKRYSMIGDGLSHVGFGALAIASAIGIAPLYVAVPVVIAAAFILLRISNSKVMGDAAIAIISSGALALGVLTVSLAGTNTDLESYMFGSIMSISNSDTVFSIILSSVLIVLYVLFYNRIFAVTFDETFSKATGTNTGLYNTVIAILIATTIVLGMRIMGALLISSLIIFPCLTAMRVCKSFGSVCIFSGVQSVTCFIIGMLFSYMLGTPTGASIVIVNVIVLIIFSIIGYSVKAIKNKLNK